MRPRAADGFRAMRGPTNLCAQRAHFLKKRFLALYIPRTARDEGARRGRGRGSAATGRRTREPTLRVGDGRPHHLFGAA